MSDREDRTMKHTPEPWDAHVWADNNAQVLADNVEVAFLDGGLDGADEGVPAANAERIVACVNGCAGIADPSAVKDMYAALSDPCMMPALERYARGLNANAVRCLENARAAIAKAEGR